MKARLFSIASLVACVACGGHEPAPANIAVLATDAGAKPVTPPLPRAPLGIPRDAIAVAVIRRARLASASPDPSRTNRTRS